MEARRHALDELAVRQRATDDKREKGDEPQREAAVVSQ